ncbi:MAG: hypothetical protein HY075_02810, partial [Deltaproteobacteria bacterium]|nr:hypothetical protein [Deltaproteobacteria bacterium]
MTSSPAVRLFAAVMMALSLAPAAQAGPDDDVEVVTTIRVLHQNVFGRRKNDCQKRFWTLGRQILEASPPFDVVSLNEVWNTSLDHWISCNHADDLQRQLTKDTRYRGAKGVRRSLFGYPTGGIFEASGGNSVLTSHKIAGFDSWKFENSNHLPVAGYMVSQIELEPGVALDLWTTHFEAGSDGCGEKCRKTAVRNLVDRIRSYASGNPVLVVSYNGARVASHSSRAENPKPLIPDMLPFAEKTVARFRE